MKHIRSSEISIVITRKMNEMKLGILTVKLDLKLSEYP